jgi:FMN phosphatase YigB (HAD superfamily)
LQVGNGRLGVTSMFRKLKLVSFDLDGTLILQNHTLKKQLILGILEEAGCRASLECLTEALSVANRYYDCVGHLFAEKSEILLSEYSKLMALVLGCATPQISNYLFEFYQSYNRCSSNFFLAPAAQELIDALRRDGVILVAISSNLEASRRVEHCHIAQVFEYIMSPTWGVPKSDLFSLMLKLTKIEATNCLHIGNDLVSDIVVPEIYGIQGILLDESGKFIDNQVMPVGKNLEQVRQKLTMLSTHC